MRRFLGLVFAATALASPGLAGAARACGFHPQLNGGFQISYPGSLEVAVAVADARSSRVLRDGFRRRYNAKVAFQQTMRDLQGFHARLDHARSGLKSTNGLRFSLLLVGPGLWSSFDVKSDVILARYHQPGPGDAGIVVLTHQSVLRALLDRSLAIETAIARKLIAFSGRGSDAIQELLEASFSVDGHRAAAAK